MLRVSLVFSSLLLLAACTFRDKPRTAAPTASPYDSAYGVIIEASLLLKEGDLVLRAGREFSSQLVKGFNRRDKSYSHAGLVFFQGEQPMVYHIVPDNENPDKKLRTDSLKTFAAPRKNAGFAIYRYDLSDAERTALRRQVEEWKAQGVAFDSTFNPKTDDRMYCSEMIAKGLARASKGRIAVGTTRPTPSEAQFFATHLRLPLSYTEKLEVVAIDNLFLNPNCTAVRRYDYRLQ